MNIIDFSNDYVSLDVDLYESVSNVPKTLAKIRGQFFVPNGKSRNGRYYTESLWNKVVSSNEVNESLSNGMLGTLLHPSNDKMAHPIYSSHVVKKLWIDEQKKGMGEAYILDTPVGRVVDTFQKSNLIKMFTSSRAWGKFEDRKIEGCPVVDEENYVFKTFDLVLDPGFWAANPKFESCDGLSCILESLSECYLCNMYDINLPTKEKEGRAKRLIEDMDKILK